MTTNAPTTRLIRPAALAPGDTVVYHQGHGQYETGTVVRTWTEQTTAVAYRRALLDTGSTLTHTDRQRVRITVR